jgi:transposase
LIDASGVENCEDTALPAGDSLPDWCVEPGEVYGAGSSGALDCCCEHVGSVSGQRALRSEPEKSAEGEWCQVEVLFDRVAWLDVGKATLTVCVRTPGPRGRRSETRTFKTTVGWLGGCGIGWSGPGDDRPRWSQRDLLEDAVLLPGRGHDHLAAQRRERQGGPGRKTDVRDADWIAPLVVHGCSAGRSCYRPRSAGCAC